MNELKRKIKEATTMEEKMAILIYAIAEVIEDEPDIEMLDVAYGCDDYQEYLDNALDELDEVTT